MTDLRPIDFAGFVPEDQAPDPEPEPRYPGWRNVPPWLRWTMTALLAVMAVAALGLIH